MLNIDNKHNITLNVGENGIIDFSLCHEELKIGDKVIFKTQEQTVEVTEFENGIAKIIIQEKDTPSDSCYYIKVEMKDGRKEIPINGKYKRMEECLNG